MNRRTMVSWRARVLGGLAATALAVVGGLVAATPAHAVDDAVIGVGSNVMGIDFEHANFGGKRLVLLSNLAGCSGSISDSDFAIGGMPTSWNDTLSSFQVFGGAPLTTCLQKLFENSNFNPGGGKTYGFGGTTSFVGVPMNDATTSIIWS